MTSKWIIKSGIAALALSLSLASQAMPTTQVTFAKGSYCGSFTGNLQQGRLFNLFLGANQELVIQTDAVVQSVRDSKGRILPDQGYYNYSYSYVTRNKGQHTVRMIGSGYSSVEFCVY